VSWGVRAKKEARRIRRRGGEQRACPFLYLMTGHGATEPTVVLLYIFASLRQRAEVFDAKPDIPTSSVFIVNPKVVWDEVFASRTELALSESYTLATTWIIRNPERTALMPLVPTSPA